MFPLTGIACQTLRLSGQLELNLAEAIGLSFTSSELPHAVCLVEPVFLSLPEWINNKNTKHLPALVAMLKVCLCHWFPTLAGV